jgi:hypothetical protein
MATNTFVLIESWDDHQDSDWVLVHPNGTRSRLSERQAQVRRAFMRETRIRRRTGRIVYVLS